MVHKEGIGTIYCILQFPPEDVPRQSAFSRVLRFLGENSSFMRANLWSDWGIRTLNLIVLKSFYLLPWVPWCGHSWQDVSKDHPWACPFLVKHNLQQEHLRFIHLWMWTGDSMEWQEGREKYLQWDPFPAFFRH